MNLEPIDLRPLSRNSDKRTCTVYLRDGGRQQVAWITAGEANLTKDNGGAWRLYARMDATDFEHDSAYVFVLPLIGVTLDFITDHVTIVSGYINPKYDDFSPEFRIPQTGYNPMEHEDAEPCDQCEGSDKHVIVPEGFYQPPFDKDLFELVRGKKVEVYFAPTADEETG